MESDYYTCNYIQAVEMKRLLYKIAPNTHYNLAAFYLDVKAHPHVVFMALNDMLKTYLGLNYWYSDTHLQKFKFEVVDVNVWTFARLKYGI